MRIINDTKPIKMWLDYLEDGAETQARHLANLPFTFRHVAIMPDAHQGYGMPIGGVLAAQDVIIPNAVGVDIGCGMCALKTNVKELDGDTIRKIMGIARQTIPVGFSRHSESQDERWMPLLSDRISIRFAANSIVDQQYTAARCQVGTLGGGNHFIEIQYGSDGYIWIMIHSGSRNLGKTVADHYNKLAKAMNEKWKSSVSPSWDLAFLPTSSDEGQAYMREMRYCVDFAFANRKLMMTRMAEAFNEVVDAFACPTVFNNLGGDFINIAHNYAAEETHFGEQVWVHRKGATKATAGLLGIIPGSQGTKSYIVRGLGNPESFQSCSHGAGRKMSRAKARENLNLQDEIAKLDTKGVVHGIRHQKDLDEASSAYKDIDEVMANQADLVETVIELSPLGVIKG